MYENIKCYIMRERVARISHLTSNKFYFNRILIITIRYTKIFHKYNINC